MNAHVFFIFSGFIICYALIVTDRFPRASVALATASFFIIAGFTNLETAWRDYIDFRTLALLTGMMIVVAILKRTGIFQYIALKMAKLAGGEPRRLFIYFAVITALLSAFLDNVTTVLIVAPITLLVCETLRKNPFPFLFMEIIASNIGGTATLIGDPPNILIGSAARFSFNAFIANLTPIVIIVFCLSLAIVWLIFKKEMEVSPLDKRRLFAFDERKALKDPRFLKRSSIVLVFILMGFFAHRMLHIEPASVAFAGGAFLLLATGLNPNEVFKELEWGTLFFFIGLFIVVGTLDSIGAIRCVAAFLTVWTQAPAVLIMIVLWVAAFLSTIFGSIPVTVALIPLVREVATQVRFAPVEMQAAWWALALGACFGGNGSIIASAANVVVADIADKAGHHITFKRYISYAIPLTLGSIILSSVYIWIRYLL
ncbi:MAG: ArsB/NhaD family transporter [Candidatus Omnitrophica bacterium]|nr:ArsB/NhaD family transporter [Candidatus Omnitrophota bacterium]